jgi:hypothetical protein
MKVPVYFRTRNELDAIQSFVMELNAEIRQKIGWDNAAWIHMTTVYTVKSPIFEHIPKNKRGDKKYIAVIHANKQKMKRLNINLEELLTKIDGIELVRCGDDGPKYTGETTKTEFVVTTESQFTALISVLDKGFGNGNWRIRGPQKNVRQIIKRVEQAKTNTNNPFLLQYVKKYQDGVPLRITVNEPNADLNKYLFKVRLKA